MSIDSNVLILAIDDRIWLDSDSLIAYLRNVEDQARGYLDEAEKMGDQRKAIASFSVGDSIRQIADGLVLATLVAGDTVLSRRESR